MIGIYLPWFAYLVTMGFILGTDPPAIIVWLPTAIIGTLTISTARSQGAIEVYRKVNARLDAELQEARDGEG